MQVFEAQEVATIPPAAAAAAHRQFEHHYAATLAALPGLGLLWRIDVETREPGQPPEQQHQVVIWDPRLRHSYGLRLWLREDGSVDGLTGQPLTADALLRRVLRYQKDCAADQRAELRHQVRMSERAQQLRRWLYQLTAGAIAVTSGAGVVFGPTDWVLAGRDTWLLLLVMSIVTDGWMRWTLHRQALTRAPAQEWQAAG